MKITTTIAAMFIAINLFAQDQPQPKETHRYVGLGIRAAGITVNDLMSYAVPPNRLVLNIDAHKYFRIEGQLGLYNSTTEVEVSSWSGSSKKDIELKDKSTFMGIGLMGLCPRENVRFVGGLRYSINNYSDDQVYYDSSGNPSAKTNTGKMTLITGIIGGEYFFAKFFSLGAEFSVSSINDVFEPYSGSYAQPSTSKTLMTEGNLIFRFYPF